MIGIVQNKVQGSEEPDARAEQRLQQATPDSCQGCRDESQSVLGAGDVRQIELELQNEEVRLANDRLGVSLEIASRELQSMTHAVSHDIKAPLRHMDSYLSILSEDFGEHLPPEAHDLLERARAASRTMAKLIDDVLELSRVARTKIANEPVDLTKVANQVCNALREKDPDRAVEVIVAGSLKARGDKTLLTQMMWNICENAWKYTSTKPMARIEIGTRTIDHEAAFFIRDNGVGFDMKYRDKLFEPFQRLHGKEFEGNGIGLATVKRIIDCHRGGMWAESTIGEGATFYFTLP